MAQVSERYHHASQLDAEAVAHPGRQDSFPPPAPALHHLNEEEPPQSQTSEQDSEQHHHTSQLGETAVAPPGGANGPPPPVPALHHLDDEHTVESQVGSSAIAVPPGYTVHPAPIPAQYHLEDDEDKSTQPPIKPFKNHSQDSDTSSARTRPTAPIDRHTSESQLGSAAVAAPCDTVTLPPPVPELHHMKDDSTNETELGKTAIASPAIASPAEFVANYQKDDAELTFSDLPPFPDNIPTAPLLRISLKKLLDQDPSETDKVWKASRELGFFYLDLRDAASSTSTSTSTSINGPALLQDVDALFSLGEQLFALPVAEKQKYDFADQGSYYGYKGLGAGVIDKQGTCDRNEFYNISKDDMLGLSAPLPAPDLLQQQTGRNLLAGFVEKSHAIVTFLLAILNAKLGLPQGRLQALHRLQACSGDQVRWVNSPPQPEDDRKKSLGEHTDFGTLTLLANRLGGLQILPPPPSATDTNTDTDTETAPSWSYVRPLRSHLIVNLGDALVRFSASILRSNIHRVVNPPGAQAESNRMSLVYFSRPEDDVVLKALTESELIREAHGRQGAKEEEEVTAKQWILRRALQRRVGGDYEKSEGTEGGRA
jgi:isopenicillin N synthase-like dioxygenase